MALVFIASTYFVTECRKGTVESEESQGPDGLRPQVSPSFDSSNASYSLFDEASAQYEPAAGAKKEPTGFSNAPIRTPERAALNAIEETGDREGSTPSIDAPASQYGATGEGPPLIQYSQANSFENPGLSGMAGTADSVYYDAEGPSGSAAPTTTPR